MTWFKVDDRFHSHPKALATSLAALGLWSVAGSWSSDHHTGGFVPDHAIPLLTRGASELVAELVASGLWKRTRGGYQFHDWDAMNPTKEEAMAQKSRKSSGGTLGNHRRWHTDRGVTKADCPFCLDEPPSPPNRSTDRRTDRGSESGASPPGPTRPASVPSRLPTARLEPPPPRVARGLAPGPAPHPVEGPWAPTPAGDPEPPPVDIAAHLAERAAHAALREATDPAGRSETA